MKHCRIFFFLWCMWFFNLVICSQDLTVTKVGEWGSGEYLDVFVQGDYAYCAANSGGLDILDIRNLSRIKRVGAYQTPGKANSVAVKYNYAYTADSQSGLLIIDVTHPTSPVLVGNLAVPGISRRVMVHGNDAYVMSDSTGFYIIDISNPVSPLLKGTFSSEENNDMYVLGSYVYLAASSWLRIIDVSDSSNPILKGSYQMATSATGVHASGNEVYVSSSGNGLVILDASTPSNPTLVGTYATNPEYDQELYVSGNHAYMRGVDTVDIIDVSNPISPALKASYDLAHLALHRSQFFVKGNHVYIPVGGLEIIDTSDATAPTQAGIYEFLHVMDLRVKGNYAYGVDYISQFTVMDVSNPAVPALIWNKSIGCCPGDIAIKDNYAYVTYGSGFKIYDIFNPTQPTEVGHYSSKENIYDIHVSDHYAYIMVGVDGLKVIDVSNPANPIEVGGYGGSSEEQYQIFVSGHYAYLPASSTLTILDVSHPSNPVLAGTYDASEPDPIQVICVSDHYAYLPTYNGLEIVDVSNPTAPELKGMYFANFTSQNPYFTPIYTTINGDYAYVAYSRGVDIIDISNPTSPQLVGNYYTPEGASSVDINGNHAYMASGGKLVILKVSDSSGSSSQIHLNRTQLHFASNNAGATTGNQSFLISTSGGVNLSWVVSIDQSWLNCSPTSGNGSGEIIASVDATGLNPGTYSGIITVSAPNADNSPQTIEVTLQVYGAGQTSGPFGVFATPIDGSTVSSSIPVTGWVLDDIGVISVKIFREIQGSLVYIGDALLVKGARPDVELAYPDYPQNYLAGWGYMMLTNFLPNGGNGTFKIHAIAADIEGHQVTLGTKTIICDNANAVKPFGAIDTPTQGGTAFGSDYVNFGWALTPLPNKIPIDGSTIQVYVDGILLGNPIYNQYREDIATLFPNYNNSNGAVGYFYLDTTQYENGVHTIAWSAEDDAGNKDGIGSRYFTIQNLAERTAQSAERSDNLARFHDLSKIPIDYSEPVDVIRGFNRNGVPLKSYPDGNGNITIEIRELERIEVRLFPVGTGGLAHLLSCTGFQVIGGQLRPLPIGSTLDRERGIFYWQPSVGFLGEYWLLFIEKRPGGECFKRNIKVSIAPKLKKTIEKK